MTRPLRRKRSAKRKPEALWKEGADVSVSESTDYDSSAEVGTIRHNLQSSKASQGAAKKKLHQKPEMKE